MHLSILVFNAFIGIIKQTLIILTLNTAEFFIKVYIAKRIQ